MARGWSTLTRCHHRKPGIEPTDDGCNVAPARICEIHDPPTGLFRCHELEGPQHMRAQLRELPHHRYGRGGWLPGFDLVRDGPQRARVVPFDVIIERDQLFGIDRKSTRLNSSH